MDLFKSIILVILTQSSQATILSDQINPDPKHVYTTFTDLRHSRAMIFTNSQLDAIPKDFFRQFPFVMTLSVASCEIRELPAFQHSNDLQFVDFSNNRIRVIGGTAFLGCHSLEELDLSNNVVMDVHKNAFSGLRNLKVLDLSGNRIESLDRSVMAGLTSVKKVNLRSNRLRLLDLNMFSRCRDLKVLSLDVNAIDQIFPTEKGSHGLTHLYLRSNRITDVKALSTTFRYLENLDLSGNFDLKVQPETFEVFTNLQFLGLDDTDMIDRLQALKPLEKLVELSIANVRLRSDFVDHLPRLGSLERLNIEDNNLAELNHEGLSVKLPQLKLLGLNSNPFICPYLESMLQDLEKKGVYTDFWRREGVNKAHQDVNGVKCLALQASWTWLIVVATFGLSLLSFLAIGLWYCCRPSKKDKTSCDYRPVMERPKYYENPHFVEEEM